LSWAAILLPLEYWNPVFLSLMLAGDGRHLVWHQAAARAAGCNRGPSIITGQLLGIRHP
jgi:hypothetical protein